MSLALIVKGSSVFKALEVGIQVAVKRKFPLVQLDQTKLQR